MNQLSAETLKTLIEINGDINSDYSNRDALTFRILRAAMRLISCESSCFITVENDTNICLLSKFDGENEIRLNRHLEMNGLLDIVIHRGECLLVNDAKEDLFYSQFSIDSDVSADSFLLVPVGEIASVSGILCLFNRIKSDFDENDKTVCLALAKLAKTALDNAARLRVQAMRYSSAKGSGAPLLHTFIAESPVIKDLMNIVKKAAVTNSSILITGESGVGKEIFAEQIYANSRRVDKPFVRVNCAALTETLMESELFGHVKGAYTSADSSQKGRFEMADGGTIFLDEVGEIPLNLQPKLLRIIQDRQFERVGSSEPVSVDVRIIAATNRNLEEMVRQGKFREGLFFRLNVLPIRVPPLRARKEDILPIAESLLKKYSMEYGKKFSGFSDAAVAAMQGYQLPGNIRELDNAVARACIIGSEPVIQKADLRLSADGDSDSEAKGGGFTEMASVIASNPDGDKTLKTALNAFKRSYVIRILEECNWNQTKAGRVLGIQRTYVSRLMNELHIRDNNETR